MHVQIVWTSIKVRVVQIFLSNGKKILKSILLVVHSHLKKKKKKAVLKNISVNAI